MSELLWSDSTSKLLKFKQLCHFCSNFVFIFNFRKKVICPGNFPWKIEMLCNFVIFLEGRGKKKCNIFHIFRRKSIKLLWFYDNQLIRLNITKMMCLVHYLINYEIILPGVKFWLLNFWTLLTLPLFYKIINGLAPQYL